MAATLGSLKLPIPNHNRKCLLPSHPLPQLFNPAEFSSFLFKEDTLPLQLPALPGPILPSVQSVSLPLMALTLLFFIGTKAIPLSAFECLLPLTSLRFGSMLHRDQGNSALGLRMPSSTNVSEVWQYALAVGREFGILEGRTPSLIHLVVMGSLFVYTLWAGYLGWQWWRVRTIQEEIHDLKKQVKPVAVTPDGRNQPSQLLD